MWGVCTIQRDSCGFFGSFFFASRTSAQIRDTQGAGLVCAMDLTKAALKKMCRDSGLYTSPALNDKLYLHYKVVCSTQ